MDVSDLIAVLARSGLTDDDYAAACAAVRGAAARIALADRLAAEVCAAQHYLPSGAVGAAIEYTALYSPPHAVQNAA